MASIHSQSKIHRYLSLVKFSHTVFAMPFAFIGFFLAVCHFHYPFSLRLLILVVLSMVFARNAAMAFNRFIDRNIDMRNPRTALREIPARLIRPSSALFFVIVNAVLFVISASLINQLTTILSPLALLIILGYSFTKYFSVLCHFILGVALALAPLGAFIAVTGQFSFVSVLFSVLVFLWVSGFDIIYSLQDEEFDRNEKLQSLPASVGKRMALRLSLIIHSLAAVLVIAIGLLYDFSYYYFTGSVIFIAILLYQHIIVKPYDLSKVNIAFFTANGLASLIYAAFVLLDFFSL